MTLLCKINFLHNSATVRLARTRIKNILFFILFFFFQTYSIFAAGSFSQNPETAEFIAHLSKRYGFSKSYLEHVFDHVVYKKEIMRQYNQPLEKATWDKYRAFFLTQERIHKGAQFWQNHEATLKLAEKNYGVPASIIVATLGVETLYGKGNGEHRAIDALANLAFGKHKRKAYFKNELAQLFLLARDLQISPLKIYSSYAGAIGMPQFMPSSYREFAVSYRNNCYPDIMHNPDDAILSIANYYHNHGWQFNQDVAIPSKKLTPLFLQKWAGGKFKNNLSVSEAEKYGIVPKYLPDSPVHRFYVLALPRHSGDEFWLGFENFKVIKRYNPSNLYAMAVFQLSHYISQEKENL